jgi:spermidine synthase
VLEAERALAEVSPKLVLVIGAAGFTFPRDAARAHGVQRVDAVDVDPVVKAIAETRFLAEKLSPSIRFLPQSARYAVRRLHKDGEHYGFTLVDAYYGKGIPEELVTVEFFRDLAKLSDRTMMNVVMDPKMASSFARSLLATFGDAFGTVWVKQPTADDSTLVNVMVANWPTAGATRWNGSGAVYRDDKSNANLDWVKLIRSEDES